MDAYKFFKKIIVRFVGRESKSVACQESSSPMKPHCVMGVLMIENMSNSQVGEYES